MSSKLFNLFDEKLRSPGGLVASPIENLDSIGNSVMESEAILRKIQEFEIVRPKVDFSDFSNFVFFNSALDYFNITGEKILNEYPYDGSDEDIQKFSNALDDYQRYVLRIWPKSNTGHLKFSPPSGWSYVSVNDVGNESGVTRTSLLNPGTSSFSVEFWALNPPALTGTNDIMVVAQKVTGSGEGFSIFYSGSNIFMKVVSGSTSDQVSSPFNPGGLGYFCFTFDRSSSTSVISSYSGSISDFPVRVSFVSGAISGFVNAGVSRFNIGSGSGAGSQIVRPFSGSLDDLRFWRSVRSLSDMSSSFNTRISAQEGLTGLWRFNESGSSPVSSENSIAFDYSGHKLHGTIKNYYSALRSSGSLLPFDSDELILTFNNPEIQSYIEEQQLSGTIYDRTNDNIINKLLPEQFFLLEEFKNTNVLRDFLYVIARMFDQIKVSIDQFAHVLTTNYGNFDQTPDVLLQDIASFFGWEFTGNFLDADVVQYLLGKQVLTNTRSNKAIETKLYEIKNEFWKRTLINLMHLYKTKGTRESVESLLRIYGVNKNFVRLKEYGLKRNAGISTNRVVSEKSVDALGFGSGSTTATSYVLSEDFRSKARGIETRVRFPTTTSTGMTSTIVTGTLWTLNSASAGPMLQRLYFTKSDSSSATGSLIYSGSEGSLSLSNLPIFDNKWYNVVVNHDVLSSSLSIDVRGLERDEVFFHSTASLSTAQLSSSNVNVLWLGSTGSLLCQQWMQEVRVWNEPLSEIEMQDHTLNFQSFGSEKIERLDNLDLHWRLDEGISASVSGQVNSLYDYSGNGIEGFGFGFTASQSPFKKFLNEFNYIASPEYGWNDEKIRSLESSNVSPQEAFQDNPFLALEFNLVDALNEDISQVLATLDTFNEAIGSPVNRYRDSYVDLEILRKNYFKRLSGHVNFRVFTDLLEFFDRSFVDMVRRLIPARAVFLGDEIVVESHMLERPKLQWNYRRKEPEFQPEGRIKVYIRT